MKFRFLVAAKREVDEAADYYTDHAGQRIAVAFLDDLATSIARVIERPENGVASKFLQAVRARKSRPQAALP